MSVVLAVFNGERYIEGSVRSILTQSFADFELIVVDDGSTDTTPEILSGLQRTDPRIVVRRQDNLGLTVSLNQGIKLARGAYLARQDADDVSQPERFARQVAYLEAHPAVAAVGTSAEVIDRSGAVIATLSVASGAPAVKRGLLTITKTPVHGSMMMRRHAIAATGGYRAAFRAGQDYDLWLRLIDRYDLDNLPDALYQWRLDGEGIYSTHRAVQLKFAALARAFAEERLRRGRDSYDDFSGLAGNMDRFLAIYQFGAFMLATWGELELRGLGNSPLVREHLRRAVRRGDVRPWTILLLCWTHLGLPWPGGRPLSSAGRGDTHA